MVRIARARSLLLAALAPMGMACRELPPAPPLGERATAFAEPDDEGASPPLIVAATTAVTANTDKQFVWPVSGWITATSTYYGGATHLGSADISASTGTPIMAARGGKVIEAGWIEMPRSGWVVKLSHGSGVVTKYSHMIRRPKVTKGAAVPVGTILGYSGRTGRAAHPHVHFAIEYWTDASGSPCNAVTCVSSIRYAAIDLLAKGDWVSRGTYIRGEYGLTATTRVTGATAPSHTYRVRVREPNLRIYGNSALSLGSAAGPVPLGAHFTVYSDLNGALKIDATAEKWIAGSGTVPVPAEADWVEPTRRRISGSQPVRTAPSGSTPIIATLSSGTIVGVVGSDPASGWYRALVRNPIKDMNEFGFLDSATAVSRPTRDFWVNGIADGRGTSIRVGPGSSYAAVSALTANVHKNAKLVKIYPGSVNKGGYRIYNGWYQTNTDQWIAGWTTAAPR